MKPDPNRSKDVRTLAIIAAIVATATLIATLPSISACSTTRQKNGYDAAVDWDFGQRKPADVPPTTDPTP